MVFLSLVQALLASGVYFPLFGIVVMLGPNKAEGKREMNFAMVRNQDGFRFNQPINLQKPVSVILTVTLLIMKPFTPFFFKGQ